MYVYMFLLRFMLVKMFDYRVVGLLVVPRIIEPTSGVYIYSNMVSQTPFCHQ